MDGSRLVLLVLVFEVVCGNAWRTSSEERKQVREMRRGIHYHAKRHMSSQDQERKRPGANNRNMPRKRLSGKPAGHLIPLKEDDIDNDEVMSVAIGPPPMRPSFEKLNWKHSKHASQIQNATKVTPADNGLAQGATTIVKDVLTQIGREFISHQVNEDFVFGQYIGNAMRNITADLKLKMQHEILELIISYQKQSRGEVPPTPKPEDRTIALVKEPSKFRLPNDTDDSWPDFTNLAKIVG